MEKTEKKYWINGYEVRAGWFRTINFNLWNIGIMFVLMYPNKSCGKFPVSVSIFKLI